MASGTTNNGSWTSMGNVCVNPRGEFNIGTSYNFLDLVSMDGGAYICLQDQTIGVSPVRNTTNDRWFCMAIAGSADREFLALKEQVNKDAQKAANAAKAAAENQTQTGLDLKAVTEAKEATNVIKLDAEKIKDIIAGYDRSSGQNALDAMNAAEAAANAVTGFDRHVTTTTNKTVADIKKATDLHAQDLQTQLDANKKTIVDNATLEVGKVIDNRKSEINNTASDEILKVQGAGNTQTGNVNAEAAKQLAAIRAAGGTLESDVERYYAMRRGYDIYTVEVLDPTVSQACTVNRLDGLAGLVCEPSTNTEKGRDDIGALDAFRPTLCNWILDADGNQQITAIKGMPNYTEEGPVNVGVLSMGLYYKKERNSANNGWLHHWSMLPRKEEGYRPMAQCIRPDNTIQGFMIHPRGAAVDIGGVPYGCNGIPKRKAPSYYNMAYPRKQGPAYCAETDLDSSWILALTMIKYGTRDIQSVMKGCTSYYNQENVAIAENNTKRVVLATAKANGFVVGSYVSVGVPGDPKNLDRYHDYMHNLADSVRILAIETVDSTNSALILDIPAPINVPATAYVSAMTWKTGSTNEVQGYDGSPYSNTDGKNICKINEIEIMNGALSVCGNVMHLMETDAAGVTTCKMYRTNDARKLTTNLDVLKTTHQLVGNIPITDNAWKYVMDQEVDFGTGIFYPKAYGGGDKTHWADAVHTGQNPPNGQNSPRELLRRGSLYNGSVSGPSYVAASHGWSGAHWNVLLTLSPNAVRGEWTA